MEKFKPILELNKLGNHIPKIICNRLLEPIDAHPIVVFYDDINEEIWYIKGRSATDSLGNYKKTFEGEILIKGDKNNKGIFKKDTLLDCSQMFKMNVDTFNKIVDKSSQLFLNTDTLELLDIKKICDKIQDLTKNNDPMVSVIHVDFNFNTNTSIFIPLYANKKILNTFELEHWKKFENNYQIEKQNIVNNDIRWNKEKWNSVSDYTKNYLLDNLHYSMNRVYREEQNKEIDKLKP